MNKLNRHNIKSKAAKLEAAKNTPLHQARTCYSHLAGVAGVYLLDYFVNHKWVTSSFLDEKIQYELTGYGLSMLSLKQVDLKDRFLSLGHACPDWTHNGYHLAGKLGKTILQTLFKSQIITKNSDRSVNFKIPITVWLSQN